MRWKEHEHYKGNKENTNEENGETKRNNGVETARQIDGNKQDEHNDSGITDSEHYMNRSENHTQCEHPKHR